MSYLFKSVIKPALGQESLAAKAQYLKKLSKSVAEELLTDHARVFNKSDDYEFAGALVLSMGKQFAPKDKQDDWAGNYVENWRMVSSNAGLIAQMVSGQLYEAYQLGLDIRSPKVIGAMFNLAVQVWSELGDYSSPSQDEGRR